MNDHTELKKLYALDVLLHPAGKPWEWWEFDDGYKEWTNKEWTICKHAPNWHGMVNYQRKDTAPDWSKELSVKEVAECDDWPNGFGCDYRVNGEYAIFHESDEWAVWNSKLSWLESTTSQDKRTLLDHFKKRREAALVEVDDSRWSDEVPDNVDPKKAQGDQKPQHHLLPPAFLRDVTAVLEHGAEKYGPYNWRESDGLDLNTYISAFYRHLIAICDGEWMDPDSNKPHIAHIAATCAVLTDAEKYGKLKR